MIGRICTPANERCGSGAGAIRASSYGRCRVGAARKERYTTVAVSSGLQASDFDDVSNLRPPICIDVALTLARPNLVRDAERGFVFGVDEELRLPCTGVVGEEREHEDHSAACEALSAE